MRKILVAVLFLMGFAGAAQATSNSFVWKDPAGEFTFSFPDSWGIQTKDSPSVIVRIAGPLNEDFATCRVKAEKDGRLKIYPKRLMTEAVYETLGPDFWQREADGYDNAMITDIRGPAGLGGKGDATAMRFAFVQDTGTAKINMYGQSIASIYGDTRYVVSCSSKLEEFEKYAPLFATIMGSVDLDSKYHPFAVGYYRDFLSDKKLNLPRTQPGTVRERRWYDSLRLHW